MQSLHKIDQNLPHLLAVGSIMIDTVIDARGIKTKPLEGNFEIPARRALGGVALNVATYAQQAGFRASLIACIGGEQKSGELVPDAAGAQVLLYLEAQGIQPLLSLDPELPTGEVILLYISDTFRKSIPAEGANAHISCTDCAWEKISTLGKIDVLFMDGHILIQPEGHSVMKHLTHTARKLSCLSVFDLVPHNLYKRMSFEELTGMISGVDVLQANFRTLRRFLKSPYEGALSLEEFNWYLEQLTPYHRWVIAEDEDTVFVGGEGERGYCVTDGLDFRDLNVQRGFGSQVAVNWLYDHFFSTYDA